MKTITYGPGDAETWPRYSGHPNDPRGWHDDEADERAFSAAQESGEFCPEYQSADDRGGELPGWFYEFHNGKEWREVGPFQTETEANDAAFESWCYANE